MGGIIPQRYNAHMQARYADLIPHTSTHRHGCPHTPTTIAQPWYAVANTHIELKRKVIVVHKLVCTPRPRGHLLSHMLRHGGVCAQKPQQTFGECDVSRNDTLPHTSRAIWIRPRCSRHVGTERVVGSVDIGLDTVAAVRNRVDLMMAEVVGQG